MAGRYSTEEILEIKQAGLNSNGNEIRKLCPYCSKHRRSHAKIRCLSIRNQGEVILYNCWHCREHGAIPLKLPTIPTIREPPVSRAVKAIRDLSADGLKYLEGRGLSRNTIELYNIKTATAYFPDLSKETEAIAFPYMEGHKIRSILEKAHVCDKALKSLFGGSLIDTADNPTLVITEGECLPGDTEVLTPIGWIKIADWAGEKIAEYNTDGNISFEMPKAYIKKPFEGELIRFSANRTISMTQTPGHRMPGITSKGNITFKTAEERTRSFTAQTFPRAGRLNGGGIALTDDQIALSLAVSADGTIDNRKNTGYNKSRFDRYIRISFKKERKIERLSGLLESLGIEHVRSTHANGFTFFGFGAPEWLPGRILPHEWIGAATLEQREFILAELVQWDGNTVPNRNQTEYSSKYIENATWVQTMAHTAGRVSTIIKRKNAIGAWFKVSILHGKSSGSYQSMKPEFIAHSKEVYCFTTKSGMFLAREDGGIFVTGNCDAMSIYEAGIGNACSIPNGAQSFGTNTTQDPASLYGFLYPHIKQLDAAKKIVIATDMDDPGQSIADELARRIGRHRCWRAKFPEKDANDTLVKHGKETLKACIDNAEPWPVAGLYEADHFFDKVDDLYINGFSSRVTTGITQVDELYSCGPGLLTVVTGIPGSGKSQMIDQIMVNLAVNHGYVAAVCSFENPPEVHIGKLCQVVAQKHFFKTQIPGPLMSPEEVQKAKAFVHRHFKFLFQEDGAKSDLPSIIERIKTAILRWGVKVAVIDPYNYISRPKAIESETQWIDDMLTEMRLFAQAYDLHIFFVAHPTKMPMNADGSYMIPKGFSISGSAAWYSKPDFGLTIHREPDSAEVRFVNWKTRFDWLGKNGEACVIYDNTRHTYLSSDMSDTNIWEKANDEKDRGTHRYGNAGDFQENDSGPDADEGAIWALGKGYR